LGRAAPGKPRRVPGTNHFGLTADQRPDAVVLTMTGTLDAVAAQQCRRQFSEIPNDRTLIVDMANLQLADTAGLACLDELQRALHGGVSMFLWGTSTTIQEVLRRTGLDQRLSVIG
jgi:anti-anti-sigma factor